MGAPNWPSVAGWPRTIVRRSEVIFGKGIEGDDSLGSETRVGYPSVALFRPFHCAPPGRNSFLAGIPSIPLRFMLGYYQWLPTGAVKCGERLV